MLFFAMVIVMLIGFACGVIAEKIVQNKKVHLARLQQAERKKEYWQHNPEALLRYQKYSRSSTSEE